MDLKDFIITNARAAGLDENQIAGIIQSACRKLPGNVPEEKYEEQIMEWISIRAKKDKENSLNEIDEDKNGIERE